MSDEQGTDGFETHGNTTLEFVLRGNDLKTALINNLKTTPWWVISVALHVVAVMILAQAIDMSTPKRPDDLILMAEIKNDDFKPLDLKKIEQVFEQIEVEQERVLQAPTLMKVPQVEMSEPTEFTNEINVSPSLSDVSDIEAGDFTEIEGGLEEGDMGDFDQGGGGLDVLGVDGGFNARGKSGSYGDVIGDLGARMMKVGKTKKYRGDVLLIWLMDASVSMKDDQEEIKNQLWTMDKKFREQEGSGKLMQAVVYFSDRPQLWLAATPDVDQVMEAISNIEPSPPGTKENVMAAVEFVAKHKQFNQPGIRARKVVVLVDDDSADDSDKVEDALKALKQAQMTLFAINRECPFQSTTLYESYEWVDEDGEKFSGRGYVLRGPETARPEITNVPWGNFEYYSYDGGGVSMGGKIMSGFGIYDISRLAYYTGGAYYILGETQDVYDWELMERYRPELVSRAEYDARTARNPFKAVIEQVSKEWAELQPSGWFTPEQLNTMHARAKKKQQDLERLVNRIEKEAFMSDSKLSALKSHRRWPANADVVWVQLNLARHRLRQYVYGLEEFKKTLKEPIPDDHRIWANGAQKVMETSDSEKDKEKVIIAMRYAASRHPRTPWGFIASSFDVDSNKHLFGYKFTHAYWFPSYWAILEMQNGKKYEAIITGEDKEKKTIDFTVPKKGSKKDVSRSMFKSITRIQSTPSSHPRHTGPQRI
ncbi:MAG: VWA domain-containing protein [Planctomycetota bacterium]|nr:VWA domain-containing protein [Planctomycetota bacterium]MDA1140519.1 VWA domain-containing protein [Planctomycetota bacterium]